MARKPNPDLNAFCEEVRSIVNSAMPLMMTDPREAWLKRVQVLASGQWIGRSQAATLAAFAYLASMGGQQDTEQEPIDDTQELEV